jgi:cytochrome c biogenesis protein CcmG/thiol:disulfide interchange protein DsbE
MDRETKILSVIAAGILAFAIAIVAFANHRDTRQLAPGEVPSIEDSGGRVSIHPSLPGGPVAAGKMAADFKLVDLKGTAISLASLRGKVVFLNVWATWCGPCREEMPSIQTLYDEFSNDRNFVVLAVNEDTGGRSPVDAYVHGNAFKFTVLLDPQNIVGDAYGVSGIPETFIIDRDGRIVAHHLGPYDWSKSEMRAALRELIDFKAKVTAKAG